MNTSADIRGQTVLERIRNAQSMIRYHRVEINDGFKLFVKATTLIGAGTLGLMTQKSTLVKGILDKLLYGAESLILLVGLYCIYKIIHHDNQARKHRVAERIMLLNVLGPSNAAIPPEPSPFFSSKSYWLHPIMIVSVVSICAFIVFYVHCVLIPAI
jgi:hypothetical protein